MTHDPSKKINATDNYINILQERIYGAVVQGTLLIKIIDQLLTVYGKILYTGQPFETGKLGVLFINEPTRTFPQCRRFRPITSSSQRRQWVSDYVPHTSFSRRLRKTRNFSQNYQEMHIICQNISSLIDLRQNIVKKINDCAAGLNSLFDAHNMQITADLHSHIRMLEILDNRV